MEKLKEKTHVEEGRNNPNIRFPEFNEDWEFRNGGDVFETVSNKNHNSDLPILAISQEFGAVPRELINYQISVTEKSVASYKVVDIGDFIISLRSFQGGIEYSNYKGICSPAYIILRPFIEIDRDFFRYYFKTYIYIQHLNSKLEGIRDGKMISYKYFSEIALPFPSLPEQKRISSFLSIVDKKIAELKQKKALLEQYKKGVMQKLFSQELRFKDENGKEFPKWEKKKLCKFTEINPKSEKLPESFIYIDLESVVQGRLIKQDRILKNEAPSRAQRLLRKNDILFQLVRPYQKNNFFFNGNDTDFVASTGYAQIRTKGNPEYLFHLLHEEEFVRKVVKKCTGTGYPAINSTDLANIDVNMPTDFEQTKIANFLSAIDKKINRTENQIQQTQEWKKGLLQNMLL
jgi:type I restriction enzyme, S subunit